MAKALTVQSVERLKPRSEQASGNSRTGLLPGCVFVPSAERCPGRGPCAIGTPANLES